MANDNNGYDELLSMFEKKEQENKSETSSNETSSPVQPQNRTVPVQQSNRTAPAQNNGQNPASNSSATAPRQKTSMSARFNREMEDISSDSSRENNGSKSGVYFSNPPRNIRSQAEREQGIALNSETKEKAKKRAEKIKETLRIKKTRKTQTLRQQE